MISIESVSNCCLISYIEKYFKMWQQWIFHKYSGCAGNSDISYRCDGFLGKVAVFLLIFLAFFRFLHLFLLFIMLIIMIILTKLCSVLVLFFCDKWIRIMQNIFFLFIGLFFINLDNRFRNDFHSRNCVFNKTYK